MKRLRWLPLFFAPWFLWWWFVFASPSMAEGEWFANVLGGITSDNLKEGHVEGVFKATALKSLLPSSRHVYFAYSYDKVNTSVLSANNHALSTYYFVRELTSIEPYPIGYFFLSGGASNVAGSDNWADGNYGGGLGMIIPIPKVFRLTLEGEWQNVKGKSLVSLRMGLNLDLDVTKP